MPKIIDNIEEKIYKSAFELFTDKGFEAVNMKLVARQSGIAVGTLYNYHKNKKELFLNVLKKSWEETLYKLNKILKNESEQDKLKSLLETLYIHISERKGIAQELMKSNLLQKEGFEVLNRMRTEIIKKIDEALKFHKKHDSNLSPETEKRLVNLIFIAMIDMRREFAGEKEKNIKFIMNMVDSILD